MAGMEDMLPEELRVLVVDDNLTCLRILELLLQRCKYKVTGTQVASEALKMLTETPKKYDIVISDVHMPGMDGFQLLENIGLHMDIPVIMLSANDDYAQVMRGIKHGAVDYLIKPVRIEELKNIWQHVVRRRNQDKIRGKAYVDEKVGVDPSKNGKRSTSPEPEGEGEPETRKRKDNIDDGYDEDGPISDNHGPSGSKRQRVVWSPDLHKKFVNAVDQLGPEKAFPKKILDIMNVEGLTRENVASHLQKYRLYLKRMTYTLTMGQPMDPTLTPFGAHDSSLFLPRGAIFNPYGPFTNLESSLSNRSMSLTLPFQPSTTNGAILEQTINHTRNPSGYISGSIPCTNQFQMNNNQVTIGRAQGGLEGLPNQPLLPTLNLGYRPQSGVPSLHNYTRCMENWQNNSVSHTVIQQNQAPPTDFNGGVSSSEISHLQNALECASIDMSIVAQSRRFDTLELQEYGGNPTNPISTSNGGDRLSQWLRESNSNPNGALSNPSYGHVAGTNTSSGLQNTEARAREDDAMLSMDENYLLDEPDLLSEFHVKDNDTLTDIVERLLN